jgi:molybdopterin-guanine dinucleotide biosynthesis protein A
MTAGAILVGGQNRRMDGYPKGQLTIDGERFIDRLHRRMTEVVHSAFVSVHDEPPINLPDEVSIIRDARPDIRASMNGVYSVLNTLDEPVLIVPWDMPLVPTAVFQHLKSSSAQRQRDELALVYRTNRTLQPFPGLYYPSFGSVLDQHLSNHQYSLRYSLRSSTTHELNWEQCHLSKMFANGQVFRNINTPSEYRTLVNQ